MRSGFGILLALLLAEPAAGQTDESKQVEPVVVTATKIDTPTAQLGTSVTVVNGEDIQTYHYPSLSEALRNVTGVEVTQSGGYGKLSTLSIRGANSNQIQILVDGMRVQSPTTGQVDLSDLSPDQISRIEVIRGPQSTLYGADAIGGVVNIITARGAGPFSATVEQSTGNYGTLSTRMSAGGTWKLFDYAFSGSHFESSNQFENASANINAANARIGLSLPGNTTIAFILRYNNNDEGLPIKAVFPPPQPVDPIIDPNQKQRSETLVLSLQATTRPVPWWESRARVSQYNNELHFQDAPDPGFPFENPIVSQINVKRTEAEWINAFFLGTWSTTTLGLEFRHEQGDDVGVFQQSTNTGSVFLEQQVRLWDRLFLSGGFRYENNSQFGPVTTGRGSIAWLIKEWGTKLRGSAGSGFRAPTFNDLFFPNFSNPNVKPERSLSWDAGIDQKLWQDRVRLSLTYFHIDFKDLIQFVPLDVFPFATVGNIGKARSQGVEFTSEVDLRYNLVASAGYTYTNTEDLETGNPLPQVPKNSVNFGLTWEPIPKLTVFTKLYFRSPQFDNFGDIFNPGWTRVDIGGTYQLVGRWGPLESLAVTARVQNLFNAQYAEVHGFPALGTNFLLGLRARF